MRAPVLAASRALVAGCVLAATTGTTATVAHAEPLPAGSIGLQAGILAGTGADAARLGYGYQVGAQAGWAPISTEERVGWLARWSFMYGSLYSAGAARVEDNLRALQMDLMLGIRIRPGTSPSRYLTLQAGGELLRMDQVIPPDNHRAFAGGVAAIGIDQYKYSSLFSIDVRVSQIGTGPAIIALVLGIGKTGG